MSWLNLFGRKRQQIPAAPRRFADPLDYALAGSLPIFGRKKTALPAQADFPALSPAEQGSIARQLEVLHQLAARLGQQVNCQELTQDAAYDHLWQAYPQLDRATLGSVLWQAFVDTR